MNPPLLLIIEDDDLQYELYEETLSDYRLVRAPARKWRKMAGLEVEDIGARKREWNRGSDPVPGSRAVTPWAAWSRGSFRLQ